MNFGNYGLFIFLAFTAIGTMWAYYSIRRMPKQSESNLNPSGGYTPGPVRPEGYTPAANQYKIGWQDELDLKIARRVKEITRQGKVDVVDEKIMRQAILEVIHNETIRLSDQLRR